MFRNKDSKAEDPVLSSAPKSKKEAHEASPVPFPETQTGADAEPEYGVESAAATKAPPASSGKAPHAAEAPPPESLKKQAEPDGKVFKFQVRNSYVSIDGAIRAGSAEEAEEKVKEWVTAGLSVKEG
jgi:hypothetical protein